jgi:hypothetical protein
LPFLSDLLLRAAIDLLALLALSSGLYLRRHSGRELVMVFVCFNVGLFAALTMITGGKFPAGIGFGLFGVLSIIRLRSQPFTPAQIGYFFVTLVLALITGLSGRSVSLAALLAVVLLIAIYLADHPALYTPTHTARLTLAKAYRDSTELREAAEVQLGLPITELRILEIDVVRDITRVAVRYQRDDGGPESTLELLDETSTR